MATFNKRNSILAASLFFFPIKQPMIYCYAEGATLKLDEKITGRVRGLRVWIYFEVPMGRSSIVHVGTGTTDYAHLSAWLKSGVVSATGVLQQHCGSGTCGKYLALACTQEGYKCTSISINWRIPIECLNTHMLYSVAIALAIVGYSNTHPKNGIIAGCIGQKTY